MDLNKLFERPATGDTGLFKGDMSGERPIIRYGLMAFGGVIFAGMVINNGTPHDTTPAAPLTVAQQQERKCSELKSTADATEAWAAELRGLWNTASVTTKVQFEERVRGAEAQATDRIMEWTRECAR